MTLHAAIQKLLVEKGQSMSTQQIADELNKNESYKKDDGSEITAFQIVGRVGKYKDLFSRVGSTVSLNGQVPIKQKSAQTESQKLINHSESSTEKDEQYVLQICDTVLGLKSSRQHKFDFLVGDIGKNGQRRKLPVDAFYETLNLVVEYCERQHSESVAHFDKPDKLTVSGVHRGEQRKIYDQRRREELQKNEIQLVEISYSDFNFNSQKRIIRNVKLDTEVIKRKLKEFLK